MVDCAEKNIDISGISNENGPTEVHFIAGGSHMILKIAASKRDLAVAIGQAR